MSLKPWYREPWPWILMSGPAAVLIAGAATLWLAFTSSDGLVADDYYVRGLQINRELAQPERKNGGEEARPLKVSLNDLLVKACAIGLLINVTHLPLPRRLGRGILFRPVYLLCGASVSR